MVIFEDEFIELSPKWKKTGTHPNFTVSAENGKLKFTFNWIQDPNTPHYGPNAWAGVVYDEPFDINGKRVSINVDMTPKRRPYEGLGYFFSEMGFMVANKKLPTGVGVPPYGNNLDPDFKAIGCVGRYVGDIPVDVCGIKIDGFKRHRFGRAMAGYPPIEIFGEFKSTSVNLYETGATVAEYVPHFDLSKSYLYLFFVTFEIYEPPWTPPSLCPEFGYFDFVRIDALPPEPFTVLFGQTMAVTLTTTLMMMNAMLLIRGLRLIR